MSVESLHGVMGPHARRLVDASVEAPGFAVAAALSAAALRAVGAEAISLDGRTIDLARFLLAAIVFLAVRLTVGEVRQRPARSAHVLSVALTGISLLLVGRAMVRGFELLMAYIPIPAGILETAFWRIWLLIPLAAAAIVPMGKSFRGRDAKPG